MSSNRSLPRLQNGAQRLGLELTPAQLSAFDTYRRELLDWNRRINLTSVTDPLAIEERHFVDSLTALLALTDFPSGPPQCSAISGVRLVDVGSGAGFPGIPLKIACPRLQITLVEATGKKAAFLQHLVEILGLSGVEVVNRRAEEVGQDPAFRERFDWAVARAVAGMSELAEYLLPLVIVDGRCLAMKGSTGPAEVQAADNAIWQLGGAIRRIETVNWPETGEVSTLVVLEKVRQTPRPYPRRPGMPHKSPLGQRPSGG